MFYFGGFDRLGMEMLEAMKNTLRDELRINEIQFKRIALLKENIFTYHLPHNRNALKRTDTRAKKHLNAHGELPIELDALRPKILEAKIKEAIESELDIDPFNNEEALQNDQFDSLKRAERKGRSVC